MQAIDSRRAQQMRDLLREARSQNARTVADAFRTRFPEIASANENGPGTKPAVDATELASTRLLKALNRAAAVEARWKTISISGA